jgi:hypothetical protein
MRVTLQEGDGKRASLDWSKCPAVESLQDRRNGRMGVFEIPGCLSPLFLKSEAGSSIEEIIEQFHVTREQIQTVLEFAARSLDSPPAPVDASALTDAHSL